MVSPITENLQYTADAVRKLISEFRSGAIPPNQATRKLEKLLYCWVEEAQELDAAAFEVLTETTLDTAVGAQLDGLGQIIGIERRGASDDRYRCCLKAQISINLASGTIPEILHIVGLVVGPDIQLTLTEGPVLEFYLRADGTLPIGLGPEVADIVFRIKAVSVHGVFSWSQKAPVFALDGAGGSKLDGGYYLRTAWRNSKGTEAD